MIFLEYVGSRASLSANKKPEDESLPVFLCPDGAVQDCLNFGNFGNVDNFGNFSNSLSTECMRIWHSEEYGCGQFDDFVRSATVVLIIEGYKEGMCGQ
jgi:hypothetical protein